MHNVQKLFQMLTKSLGGKIEHDIGIMYDRSSKGIGSNVKFILSRFG